MVGIYRVVNHVNGKCYVGQSTNIEKRWGEHRRGLNYHKHDGYHLYEAIRKYGLHNFDFEVLEECDVSVLDEREKHWICVFNSYENGYNMNTGGRKIPEKDRKIIYDLWSEDGIESLFSNMELMGCFYVDFRPLMMLEERQEFVQIPFLRVVTKDVVKALVDTNGVLKN